MTDKLIKLRDESEEWEYLEWCIRFPERKPSAQAKRKSENAILVRVIQYNDGHADFEYSDGKINSHDISHIELPLETGECGEPQKLDIS